MSLLKVRGLSVRYGAAAVVDDVSFDIRRGESVGVVGESGSGKTQTALALLGLLPASAGVSGSARLDGLELIGAGERRLNSIRAARIGVVFQDPTQALNPYLCIGAQLQRVLEAHRRARGAAAREQVLTALERVGLPDPARQFDAYPHQLSGGMRQRAMIASGLLLGPDLLIADEPTTALDVTVQAQVLAMLEEIRDDTALLLITHDLGVIAGQCERLLVLENGRVVESGGTNSVFRAPDHAHTRALLDAAPRIGAAPELPPPDTRVVLTVEGAAVRYGSDVVAVRDASLSVRRGETLAIVGESGSGKSSLVRAALGLVPLAAGTVSWCGERLPPALEDRARDVRRDLQLVFQDPLGSLNPQMSVGRAIAEPLGVHRPGLDAGARDAAVAAMLERVGLGEPLAARYPHELSGGQAQRVAIARALISDPAVLICDEAVAALDGTVRRQVLGMLSEIQADTGLGIVFIAHDLAVVQSISHRVLVMYLGRAVELADAGALFGQPQHPYTQALIAAVPVPDPLAPGAAVDIEGEPPSPVAPPPGCAFHPRCPRAADDCRVRQPELRRVAGNDVACHYPGPAAAAGIR